MGFLDAVCTTRCESVSILIFVFSSDNVEEVKGSREAI